MHTNNPYTHSPKEKASHEPKFYKHTWPVLFKIPRSHTQEETEKPSRIGKDEGDILTNCYVVF